MFHAVKPFTSLILCLGGRFGSILCRTSCFASVGLEEMVEFILFFQIDRGKTACAARKWTKSAPQNRRNNLCLCFSLHPSSMPEKYVTDIFIEFWACALHILCFLLFTAKGFEYIICTVLTVWSVGPQAILWGGPPDRISNPGWAVQRQGHWPILYIDHAPHLQHILYQV